MSIFEYNEEEVLKLIRTDEREGGREEGIKEGKTYKTVELVCKKLLKGKTANEIADDLEETLPYIESICELARHTAPDYDVESICNQMLEQKTGFIFFEKNKERGAV